MSNPKALKTASITVRFSPPECAQLRTRAAEADLTVSAYLRSCALEVEALRAQVKDALAQLRDAKAVSVQLSGLKPTRNNVLTMLQHLRQWIRSFRPARRTGSQAHSANTFAPLRD